MLLVYCDHITPRIRYIFHYMLHTLCGFDIEFSSDEIAYRNHSGASLNYSHKALKEPEVQIRPSGLLHLQSITHCQATIKQQQNFVQLYLQGDGVDTTCFDPFAAAFYLLTRYEEYLPFATDAHNRFEARSSILYKEGLLHRPLINEWAASLKQTFSKAHTLPPARTNPFTYKITVDIDQVYAFQHRGVIQNLASFAKNLAQRKLPFLKSQVETILLGKNDPYDTFDYLKEMQQRFQLPVLYFFNAGTPSAFDKNGPLTHVGLKKLLKKLSEQAEVGIHPSYYTDTKPEKIKSEKAALETVLSRPVVQSRQHYLKLRFPHTYRQLLAVGITEDYTMGYATQPGFRASTCTPFFWFDLEQNETTLLKVYPITYMEGTFGEDLALSLQQALAEMKKLTDTVRHFNGCLIPIWHNHTVNDQFFWKGWKAVFEESLHYIL